MKQLTWLLLPTVIICLKQTAMDVKSSLKKDHLVVVVSEVGYISHHDKIYLLIQFF